MGNYCQNCGITLSYWKGDLKALEDLDNNSVCVVVGNDGIRKVRSAEDVDFGLLVFVSNFPKADAPNDVIYKDEMIRYKEIQL